eukprot:c33066_g1_i1 orf=118-360(+)
MCLYMHTLTYICIHACHVNINIQCFQPPPGPSSQGHPAHQVKCTIRNSISDLCKACKMWGMRGSYQSQYTSGLQLMCYGK